MKEDFGFVGFAFFATWIVLMIVGFVAFVFYKNAAFKRKWYPWFCLIPTILMPVFMYLLNAPKFFFIIMIPALVVIYFMNVRFTVFCDNCGRTINSAGFFTRIRYCPTCG